MLTLGVHGATGVGSPSASPASVAAFFFFFFFFYEKALLLWESQLMKTKSSLGDTCVFRAKKFPQTAFLKMTVFLGLLRRGNFDPSVLQFNHPAES